MMQLSKADDIMMIFMAPIMMIFMAPTLQALIWSEFEKNQ